MFKIKTINSLEGMKKAGRNNLFMFRLELILLVILLILIYVYSYLEFVGFIVVFSAMAIIDHQDMRYWNLKEIMLTKTKLEKEKK